MEQSRIDAILAGVAAVILLFCAILDPLLSTILAVVLLLAFVLYKLMWAR